MNALGAVSIVVAALTVAVLAAYLITVALLLRSVTSRLVTTLAAIRAVAERSQAAAPLMDEVNRELDDARRSFEGHVARLAGRQSLGASGPRATPLRRSIDSE